MPLNLDTYLGVQPDALKVYSQRAEVLAANLANADTPGYQAQRHRLPRRAPARRPGPDRRSGASRAAAGDRPQDDHGRARRKAASRPSST